MTITAAADGSALGNPGPAGWAWYVDEDCWGAGGWPHGTNNMGELMAVLDLFRATRHMPEEKLHILCDSQYVINCVTKWMAGWKRKGWKKSDGKPVLNMDLLKDIDKEIVGRTYEFEWVKGHAGHALNEAADDKARAAATAYQSGRPADAGPGFAGSGGAAAAEPEPAAPLASAGSPAPPAAGAADDVDTVLALERELQDPEVCGNISDLDHLLHPEFREISRDGSLTDKARLLAALAEGFEPLPVGRVDLLAANKLAPTLIQIAYRMVDAVDVVLCSSLWERAGDRWRLRFRQETPTA
ncbi:ribonuclease HI family protein [Paeniglutamicibacter cryotolerans]|uniref:ribonuclease H n=1 Tax=Paeniglutamicibacter cryotolerans TaxID=670079 RepID=A0A839QIM4_9MICC|nr:ribonuclease HI family protein [Paeniglutamicibacter cryotolerans]MBB2994385.1 ribonuclease HI [Paeniglutamicibacter cryotolerans]